MFFWTTRKSVRMKSRPGTVSSGGHNRVALRAAPVAQVRLRCLGPQAHRFRAAEQINCPMCMHKTVIIGPANA